MFPYTHLEDTMASAILSFLTYSWDNLPEESFWFMYESFGIL